MSEAPERIWATLSRPTMGFTGTPELRHPDDVEYVRADLAGLPEELVERINERLLQNRYSTNSDGTKLYVEPDARLLNDILAWHERQKGGKE